MPLSKARWRLRRAALRAARTHAAAPSCTLRLRRSAQPACAQRCAAHTLVCIQHSALCCTHAGLYTTLSAVLHTRRSVYNTQRCAAHTLVCIQRSAVVYTQRSALCRTRAASHATVLRSCRACDRARRFTSLRLRRSARHARCTQPLDASIINKYR
jgi:hypothetical protein